MVKYKLMKSAEKIDSIEILFDPTIDSWTELKEQILTSYKKNKLFFGQSLTAEITISIVYTREEMNDALKRDTAEWLVGSATQDGHIYIFSPKIFSEVSSHTASNFDPILTHELAHIFTNDFSKFGQPVWLKEGIAGHIAQQFINKHPKKISDFENLHSKEDWQKAPNYAQATIFTTFLIEKFGREEFLKFLKRLSENEDARKKFIAFTELFENSFNADFQHIVLECQKKMLPQQKSLE